MAAGQSFQDYTKLRPGPDPAQVGAQLAAQQPPMMPEGEGEPEAFGPPLPEIAVEGEDLSAFEHSPLSTATALQEAIQRAMRGPSRPQERRARGAYSSHQLAALLPAAERAFLES